MVDEKKIEILDKAFDRLKDFETLMDNFESRFSKFGQNFVTMPKRPYLPIYNEKADYNTNAQSYYDYLARINRYLHEIEIVINIILERLEHLEDIETKQTLSITPTQIGKLKDISEIVNNVNISLGTVNYEIHGIKKEVSNGTLVADWGLDSEKSGLFSKDLTPYLEDIYIKIDIINDNLNRLDNVDVGNHLSLSSDKNTLILTRKNLKGTALTSDNVPVGIGDIINDITNIYNELGKFEGGTVTVLQNHWDGKVNDGGTIDTTLTNGSYQIYIESPTVGSFSLRLPWAQSSDINQVQTGFSLPLSNQANGDFGFIKCTINSGTAGKNPTVKFAETIFNKATGTTTVKNGNTDWYILIIKKEKAVTIG